MNKSFGKEKLDISKELFFSFILFSLKRNYPIKGKEVSAQQVTQWATTIKKSGFLNKFSEKTFIDTLWFIIRNSENPIGLQVKITKSPRQLQRLYWLINKKKGAEDKKQEDAQLYDKLLNLQKFIIPPQGKQIDRYI